jgi:hypothetical protein
MAITRSSFMGDRGGSGGTISARGMRRISPKDTANLLKSVNAINKNLVAINKALKQQGALGNREQQQEQNRKRVTAEKLQREKAESAIEAPKKVGEGLKRALEKPAKQIFKGLMNFINPFVKFFAIGFIGWFAKGVVGWFKQEKEKKKKQIKEAIPKILTFMTVAGGVLLALKFGIPVILTTLTAIVTAVPTAIGALLNPVTWTALLGVATAGIATEMGSNFLESIIPGQRASKRISALLGNLEEKYMSGEATRADYGERDHMGTYLNSGGFYKIDGVYYRQEELRPLLNFAEEDLRAIPYRLDKNGVMIPTADEALSVQGIREGRMLKDLTDSQRNQFSAFAEIRQTLVPSLYEYKRQNDKLYSAQENLKGKNPGTPQYKEAQEEVELRKSRRDGAMNLYKAQFDKLSGKAQEMMFQIGVGRETPLAGRLSEGEVQFQLKQTAAGIANNVLGTLNLPSTVELNALGEKISKGTAELTDRLAESISEFEINLNVNPIADLTEDDSDESIPTPGGIAPFNLSDPYVQYSKKTYLLLGVI